jgi:hypothetical protein
MIVVSGAAKAQYFYGTWFDLLYLLNEIVNKHIKKFKEVPANRRLKFFSWYGPRILLFN